MTLWLLASCTPTDDYVRLYHTMEVAPSFDPSDVAALEHMGPTMVDDGVNFAVYSENATRIDLLLFDDPEASIPTQQFEMTPQGNVYNLFVEGVGNGQHYGFVAWGPNWPFDEAFYPGSTHGFLSDVDDNGNRFNPNKLLFDPYAKHVHRDHDWGRGFAASGPYRDHSTWGAGAKGVVVESDYVWSDNEAIWREKRQSGNHEGHQPEDAILYEVHLKGFTKNAASTQWGAEHFGTFAGMGEAASYFQDLGITAVELLPVNEKPLDGTYWGYNPISYFAMENAYSADLEAGEPDAVINEFKEMVDQLHQHDIEVILDVVYNHTGEGGLWRTKLFYDDPDGDGVCDPANAINLDSLEVTTTYTFRGLDNAANYVLGDDARYFWDHTGTGNQVRTNHAPMRRLILDSLRYLVEELHVDGFRFDLAGVMGEPDGGEYWEDVSTTLLQDIVNDPVLQKYNTRLIAEPWTIAYDPSGGFPVANNTKDLYGWGEWNANFRDWWRSFINSETSLNTSVGAADGGGTLTGTNGRYSWNGRLPWHSVNFITAHDGFTMFDMLSYSERENACGPLNPTCCDDACSVWCDVTSGSSFEHERNWEDDILKRQMMRNWFTALMVSHGTPMMLGGDEWMRTQYGNNNAYSDGSDNEWNWFRWGEWTSGASSNAPRHRMHGFVKGIIALRKQYGHALKPAGWNTGMPYAWKNSSNSEMGDHDWGGKAVMMHYYDDGKGLGDELALLINMNDGPVTFTLPEGRSWARLVDTQAYFDEDVYTNKENLDPWTSQNISLDAPIAVGATYEVQARSMVIVGQQ